MLKSFKILSALLAAVLVLSAQGARIPVGFAAETTNQPSLPETPLGDLLKALVNVINHSSDVRGVKAFVKNSFASTRVVKDAWPTRCCLPEDVLRTITNVARRSGGIELDSIHTTGAEIMAVARAKYTKTRVYIDIQTNAANRITNYEIVAVPPGTEAFLPKNSAALPLAKRLGLAKRSLEKAADRDLFSGSIIVAKKGKVLISGAYGQADKVFHRLNVLDTPYPIASLGKLFTGVAVAQLVEQGKLNYDEPIIHYLPDYPNKTVAEQITLRELLTHTSGLSDIFANDLLPVMPPFMGRVCSGYAPQWGVLQTPSV